MSDRGSTLVLGVGNPLMTDDGLGLAALEILQRGWQFDPDVDLVDGGTWGMRLLPAIEDADRLLILDAIDKGADPGTLVELTREELPFMFATKVSPHQIDLREVLALASLRGTLPRQVAAIGLQPDIIEMGASLSPRLARGLDSVVQRAVWRLEQWGHRSRQLEMAAEGA